MSVCKKILGTFLCVLILMQASACGLWNSIMTEINTSSDSASNVQSEQSRKPQKNDVSSIAAQEESTSPTQKVEINPSAEPQKYRQISDSAAAKSSFYPYVSQQNGYACMNTSAQRKAYLLLMQAAYQVSEKKEEDGRYAIADVKLENEHMEEREIRKVVSAFKNDNPQIFWLANLFGYVYSGGNTIIQLYSVMSAQEATAALQKLNQAVSTVVHSIEGDLSEFDRELRIHNYLVENCSYDKEAAQLQNEWQAFTAYGALVENNAVCEGYARAMQLLLSYLDMHCLLVNGTNQNGAHMWNLVQIGQSWYHLDVTWDDTETMERYDYFNLTDTQISYDHKIDYDYSQLSAQQICGQNGAAAQSYNLSLPACEERKYNYFSQKAVQMNSLNQDSDNRVIQALRTAVQQNEKSISLQFEEGMDYTDTIDKMFMKTPYKFLYYIEGANEGLSASNQINPANVVFSEIPQMRAVTVQLG